MVERMALKPAKRRAQASSLAEGMLITGPKVFKGSVPFNLKPFLLFSHVRGHRKGSIDPTRLKIRIVVNGRRTSNQVMRRHLDTVRERLEKYAVNVREAKDAEAATKAVIEKHEAVLREARAKLKEIEESTSLEQPMNTSEAVGLSLGHQQHRSTEPAATAVTPASGVGNDVSKTIEKLVPERTGTVLEKKTGTAGTDNKKVRSTLEVAMDSFKNSA